MRAQDGHNEDDGISDNRRARLADVQRLEAALERATGQLQAMQDMLNKRDEMPIPKAQFYAQFYVMCTLSGRNQKHLRSLADAAWRSYKDVMENKPGPTINEMYVNSSPSSDESIG